MRKELSAFALGTGLLLSGCATTSFAPPEVTFATHDTLNLNAALLDIDVLAAKYRRAARETGDSRQAFEVPAFAATLGAITASALGAGTDVAIAAGAANTVFNSGKAYYAPKSKAQMYDSALSALYCIQQVALGVKPFADSAAGTDARALSNAVVGDDTAYYYLVRNAGRSVERALSHRLSNAGSLTDAESLAAEFEKKVKELEAARNKPQAGSIGALSAKVAGTTTTPLDTLQPELELCISRAKV